MSEKLIITCIPSLVSTLLRHERDKGAPLTEEEVLQIRDNAPAVALPVDAAASMERERGYRDIDLDRCWEEWQHIRLELDSLSPPEA
jgi:hypothetical protein